MTYVYDGKHNNKANRVKKKTNQLRKTNKICSVRRKR